MNSSLYDGSTRGSFITRTPKFLKAFATYLQVSMLIFLFKKSVISIIGTFPKTFFVD